MEPVKLRVIGSEIGGELVELVELVAGGALVFVIPLVFVIAFGH